ncbi:hypothetical protein [Sideroxydans sp. CL21]|nr:hypothetical protein [Sideroxydans sp. CL21]
MPPYFGNPKVKGLIGGRGKAVEISCPGTYGYKKIDVEPVQKMHKD